MEIPRDLRPADPSPRKRVGDGAGKTADKAPTTHTGPADHANFGDIATISRYVDVLKTMNPANLHKVEDLRARIADGSYSADPEELADLILGDRREPGAVSGRKPV